MSTKEKKSEMAEYVAKMIEQMSPSDIAEMLAEYDPAMVARLNTADLPDPGPELRAGEDSVVEAEDLPLFEVIISTRNNLLPVHFLEEGAAVQKAVCKVNVPGRWVASGFMVSRTLMLTNNHVLPSLTIAQTGQALFSYQTTYAGGILTPDTFALNPDSLFYTNPALDYSLVRVKPRIIWLPLTASVAAGDGEIWDGKAYEAIPEEDGTAAVTLPPVLRPIYLYPGDRYGSIKLRKTIFYVLDAFLNIIQHPGGRRKEVALQDNNITNMYSSVIRYTTDTEPGSSGSPVFDNAWDLVALHHAAGERAPDGTWVNNEGMRVDKIAADLIAHYSGLPTGAAVLAELGLA